MANNQILKLSDSDTCFRKVVATIYPEIRDIEIEYNKETKEVNDYNFFFHHTPEEAFSFSEFLSESPTYLKLLFVAELLEYYFGLTGINEES